ncbi:MAG: hypothetical protein MJ249_08765, partial [Kiritimatiellae bacterium]|nr:hypothetical protein [Kiritimatiellia bacterium]
IDFDNGAKPVGTASFGLDLRCGLLSNGCPNEDSPVRIFHFSFSTKKRRVPKGARRFHLLVRMNYARGFS